MVHQFKKAPKKEEACCLPGEGLTDEEFASFCKTPEELKRIPNGVLTYPEFQFPFHRDRLCNPPSRPDLRRVLWFVSIPFSSG